MAPRFVSGANTAGRVPTTTSNRPSAIVEPRPVPRTLVPSDEHRDPLPERLHDRRRGRRHRHRLRHQHDRPSPPGEAPPNRLDGDGHLVLRRRPNHERPRPAESADESATPFRYDEKRSEDRSTSDGGGGPAERGMGWLGKRSGAAATPSRASPPRRLFRSDPRRHRPPDHRGQRRDVPLAHPPQQAEHVLVEEAHRRHDLLHPEHPRPERLRGSEHPPADQASVERHLHERPHPGVELGREQVRERPIEAEDGAVDADRDGALQAVRGQRGRGQRGRG